MAGRVDGDKNKNTKTSRGEQEASSAVTDTIEKATALLKNKTNLVIVILVAVIIVLLIALMGKNNTSVPDETATAPTEDIIVGTTEAAPEETEDYELKKDAVLQLNTLIHTYFEAMKNCDAEAYSNVVAGDDMTVEKLQKKGEYIEDYQNISCYTKPGMTEGTYVTYVYYEVKFRNVETPGPALIQLYVCTNEDGTMYINSGALDTELTGYINTVSSDEQVRTLIADTDQKMKDAMAADEKLARVVEWLNQGGSYVEETVPEETVVTDVDQMTFEDRDEKVLTTTTVRIRSTPTTENDDNIVGKVEPNEELQRIGYNSLWSKVTYNGEEAYVSSSYLITK